MPPIPQVVSEMTVGEILAPAMIFVGGVAVIQYVRKTLGPAIRAITHMWEDWRGEPARPGRPARPGIMERVSNLESISSRQENRLQEVEDAIKELGGSFNNEFAQEQG